jgi:hypothetical protein
MTFCKEMKTISRSKKWIGVILFFTLLFGLIYLFGAEGEIRRDTGLWFSPLAVFSSSNVSSDEYVDNVAVFSLSDSERAKLMKRLTWERDDEVVFSHKIPWYSDLVCSTAMEDVLRLAKTSKKYQGWQASGFSISNRKYSLYYDLDSDLLWLVQITK